MNKEFNPESKMNNVFFNHANAIIDDNTYDEIKKSDFLKNEFCHCEEQTHTSADKSWTGFYIVGENTYIEFFSNKDKAHLHAVGVCNAGIGFSVDRKEEFENIIKIFKQKLGDNIKHGLYERNINNTLVPWFYFVGVMEDPSVFDTWIMAYHKDYCKKNNAENITRKAYNQQYNAVQFDKNKLFKDIEEVTLLLSDENKIKFVERQTLLGYTCEEVKDCTICKGPGVTFILKTSDDQTCKLSKLCMSFNREINDVQIYKLGNSTLELENKTATLTF